jgi:hypothetical protein
MRIHPTKLRKGMKTRIPPTPPRVLADDREPMSEALSRPEFKIGIV